MAKTQRALLAELVGAFGLTLIVYMSLANPGFPVSTPVLAALTLGLFVVTVGGISGAHLNPAVTIGQAVIKRIDVATGVSYIIAQTVGALLAAVVASQLFDMDLSGVLVVGDTMQIGLAEAVGAFFFTFGIAAVVSGRVKENLSGPVVGLSLLLGIAVAAIGGANGVLNPAVALGIGSFNVMYLVGPILGSVVGFWFYSMILDS